MIKKTVVLAMAVGAVAAFALPASAGAQWLHNHSHIQVNQTVLITGQVRFQTTLGGLECQITSQMTLLAGQSTATVDTFKPDNGTETEKCKGTGGLAFCQIHNLTPQAPGWIAHTGTWHTTSLSNPSSGTHHTVTGTTDPAIIITTQTITSQTTGGFCPGLQEIHLTGGSIALIPDDPTTIQLFQVNGILESHLTTGQVQHTDDVLFSGSLQFENASEKGTWGFTVP